MKIIPFLLSALLLFSCGQGTSEKEVSVSQGKPTSVLAPVFKNNRWGFIDTTGAIVIPAEFSANLSSPTDFPHFQEGLCVCIDPQTSLFGAIDSSGKWVIRPRFFSLAPFSEGISSCQLCSGCKSIFVDKKDSTTIFTDYNYLSPFANGLASVEVNGRYGFIDRSGKIVIQPQFNSVLFFTCGYSMVDIGTDRKLNGEIIPKLRFINLKGEILAPDQYDNADFMFTNGFAVVSKNVPNGLGNPDLTKQGLINRQGKLVVPLSFRFWFRNFFKDGLEFAAAFDEVQKGNKLIGLIDSTGKWIAQPIFEDAKAFAEELAPVKQNGKWGFIDKNGKMVITPQFDSIDNFSEGLAAASLNGKFGYIDHSGNWIIKPTYEAASFFKFGLASVKMNNKYGYVNPTGKWIIPASFDKSGLFQDINVKELISY